MLLRGARFQVRFDRVSRLVNHSRNCRGSAIDAGQRVGRVSLFDINDQNVSNATKWYLFWCYGTQDTFLWEAEVAEYPMGRDQVMPVNGIQLAYREWPGDGEAILCLPSFAGHKGGYDQLAKSLAPAYRVIALDLRGRGDSDKPASGYGFAYHALDILALADALGLERFSLLGHSFGATVATYLASIRPGRVSRLMLLEGGADPTERVLEAIRPSLQELTHTYIDMDAYFQAMRELPYFRNAWGSSLEAYLAEDVVERSGEGICHKASAPALHQDLDLHYGYSMCLHFPAVQCPVLFARAGEGMLGGDQGHIFTEPETDAIVRWIPKGQRLDVPGVNHFTLLLGDETSVAESVRAFLMGC